MNTTRFSVLPARLLRIKTARAIALTALATSSLAPIALADWSHDLTIADPNAPAWFLAGTNVSNQSVSGSSVLFSTRPGALDNPQVGVLGTPSQPATQVSTALAVVIDREDDATISCTFNIEGVAQTGRQGVAFRVTDDLQGFAALLDFSTAELMLARFNLSTQTFTPIVTQPILNYDATKPYRVVAISDGPSIVVRLFDLRPASPAEAIAGALGTTGLDIPSGYAGLFISSTNPANPCQGTFGNVSMESLERECDFNDDNEDDIFWLNQNDGTVWVWTMNDATILGAQYVGAVPANQGWKLVTTADFNDDSAADLIWHNTTTGECGVWLRAGSGFTWTPLPGLPAANWELVGCGELTKDGQPDIIWRNKQTNALWLWEMSRTQIANAYQFFDAPTGWGLQAVADMNRDGDDDLLFRNTDGSTGLLTMRGTTTLSWIPQPFVASNWRIVGLADLDDDESTDLLWRNDTTGECGSWIMNRTAFESYQGFPSPGLPWNPAN
jgi:hypothetical protein